MSKPKTIELQKEISDLEKFIQSVLDNPITPHVKRIIVDVLHLYKARLIDRFGDEARLPKYSFTSEMAKVDKDQS